jgi:hypothetical protein
MTKKLSIRLYACVGFSAAVMLLAASPAWAQYRQRPLSDPATGEKYHIEGAANFWFPSANLVVASASLGIPGDEIDAKRDLGLTDKRFPEVRLTLRPSQKSKFRFQYIPIQYTQGPVILPRSFVFNGQRYTVGLPVNSTLDWKAYRIGFEYDFVSTNRVFVGLVTEAKYTDVQVQVAAPFVTEFARARAPIPAIGGIARVYVVPNIAVTTEITGFSVGWLPESLIKDNSGHYVDVDVYGTLNFTNNVGLQVGYRSLDFGYVVKTDSGTLKMKGMYLGIVARY